MGKSSSEEELSRGERLYYHQLPLSQFTGVHKYESVKIIAHQGKIRIGVTIENQAHMPAVARQHEENRGWADRPGAWHEAVSVRQREDHCWPHLLLIYLKSEG